VRLTVELEGKATVVEVSDDLGTVRVGGKSFPVKVVARGPLRVDLEIGGEVVAVSGWPEHNATPPGPVDLNGERWRVVVRAEAGAPVPSPGAGPAPIASAAVPGPASAPLAAGAVAIVPPMPGRVVEVRVKEGDAVRKGAVLLVLEAMKMRNEITAPMDGVVRDLRVEVGTNARAHDTLLVVVPKPA